MNPDKGRGGDLYNSNMGNGIMGGKLYLGYKGNLDRFHHSIYGEDRHFSWDTFSGADADMNVHGTEHTKPRTLW